MRQLRIIKETQLLSFILIGLAIFGFVIVMFQLTFYDGKPENFGVVGDAVGGILNPVIAIASSLLTFLAFYIQKLANDELKLQFLQQQLDAREDFLFKSYKERAMLIINEINNFNVSFHDGTLISNPNVLNRIGSKKYNFIGIQAINLFFVEFYKIVGDNLENFNSAESFHATSLHLNNLISAFYNLHVAVEKCELKNNYSEELQELLEYIYYSKLNYFFKFLIEKRMHEKIKEQILYLFVYYEKRTKVEE